MLRAIREDISIYISDGIIRLDSFENFRHDLEIINAYEDDSDSNIYDDYLKIIFNEIQKGKGEAL